MDIKKEKELIKHRCCFTGHREEKITVSKEVVVSKLRMAIHQALNEGYTTFITGMANGVDIWSASIVLEFKEKYPEIKLIAAVPFPNFGKTRNYHYNIEFKRVLERADYVKYISKYYHKTVFKKRNTWMVDHSIRVIAVCHRELDGVIPGGTKNTIEYAQKQGKELKIIEI